MRRASYLVALSVVALLMLVPAAGAQNAWSVSIGDNFFAPADAAVGAGDTITWTNNGAEPHTVTAFDGSFDSGTLMPGESFTLTFDQAGTYWYYCQIHPQMIGSVTVAGSEGADVVAPPAEEETVAEEAGASAAGGS